MALREIADGYVDRHLLTQKVEDDRDHEPYLAIDTSTF
jgi:hypothetical protein